VTKQILSTDSLYFAAPESVFKSPEIIFVVGAGCKPVLEFSWENGVRFWKNSKKGLKLDSMHPSKKKLVENKAVSVG
jgi:hypothetical protein